MAYGLKASSCDPLITMGLINNDIFNSIACATKLMIDWSLCLIE